MRDHNGRFTRPAEARAIAGMHRKQAATADSIFGHNPGPPATSPGSTSDPVHGRRPNLGGGPQGIAPYANPAHQRAAEREAQAESFLDAVFPNRGAGARYHPYSLTNPEAPLYRKN